VAAGVGAEALAKAGVVRRQRGAMEKVVKVVLEGASLMKTQAMTGIVNRVGRETLLAEMCALSVVHHNRIAAAEAEVEAVVLRLDAARVARVLVGARVIVVGAAERFLQAPESGREVVRQEATHHARLRSPSPRRCGQGLALVCGTRCTGFQTSSLVRSLIRSHRAWWWTSTPR